MIICKIMLRLIANSTITSEHTISGPNLKMYSKIVNTVSFEINVQFALIAVSARTTSTINAQIVLITLNTLLKVSPKAIAYSS